MEVFLRELNILCYVHKLLKTTNLDDNFLLQCFPHLYFPKYVLLTSPPEAINKIFTFMPSIFSGDQPSPWFYTATEHQWLQTPIRDRQTKYTPPCTHLQPLAVLRFPWGLCISYSLCGVFLSYPIFSSFSLQAKSGVMSQQRQIEVVEKHEGGNTQHSNSATVVVTLCSQNFFWEISPEISQFLCSWV